MRIFANDGKEFKTVEEALAYEKKISESYSESYKELRNLIDQLNQKVQEFEKRGWEAKYSMVNGKLSISLKKQTAFSDAFDFPGVMEALCR